MTTRRSALAALLSAAFLLAAFAFAPAASSDPPDAPWAGSGDFSGSSGPSPATTVVNDGTAGAAVFTYDNDAPGTGGSGASGEWEFTTVAAADGTIELDWEYSGFHAFFQVNVELRAVVYHDHSESIDEIVLVDDGPVNCCTSPSGGFRYSGIVELEVHDGDEYGFLMSGSNGDLNSRLTGTLTVDGAGPEPEDLGTTVLLQAVPSGSDTFVVGQVFGTPSSVQDVQFLTDSSCTDGELDSEAPSVFATTQVTLDSDGEAFFAELVTNTASSSNYAAAQTFGTTSTGDLSDCIVVGPDNDTWTRALPIPLSGGTVQTGSASGFVDSSATTRWYRFDISPGARATVTLENLPADYDLFLFNDIAQAYEDLSGPSDVDGLNRLGAEFAPSVFSPAEHSPSVFSPSVFSPDAYAPSVFSPSVFSPSVFSPSVFSPSVFSPDEYSPSVFSGADISPSVFSPSVFSPSVFSPSVFSPSVFGAENFASAQTRSLVGVSAKAGTGSETVVADTWNNTGSFYVAVSGKNGAFDVEAPFDLQVSLDGALCAGVNPIAGNPAGIAGGYETIILWDPGRIDTSLPGNSAAEIATLQTRLDTLAARPDVNGLVVDLGGDARVQALHAQADAATSCPYAANLVAGAIKDVIDAHRAANPGLRYVVIAGSDREIPFYRYSDTALLGPEADYDPPVADGTHSQAALRLNYVLGQDQYGATTSLNQRDGQFPLPDLAVGRLVETAAEMTTVVDAYLGTANGVVADPSSTLVTGYDFLDDAANEVQSELTAGTGFAGATLITPGHLSPEDPASWTADDLRANLLADRHDIVYLAGHFSANSALAADYETTIVTTELAASSVDLTNSIVFSAGCHSGYNIVDSDVVPGVTLPLDWAQAFAQKGATLIAGTGYQYGDTDFLEYSERLYAQFARELRTGSGPVSVGEALVRAKQQYLETTPEIRGLHRKALLESAVFGLPMLSVDMPGTRFDPPADPSVIGATNSFATDPGSTLGLSFADLNLSPALTPQTVTLTNLEGGTLDATYLEGPDGVVTNPAEPALPLVSQNVTVAGQSLRGIGFRGGSWTESSVVPLTGAPTTELRGVHVPFVSPVNYPMRLATPNYFGAMGGGGDTRLSVTPAQHRVETLGDIVSTLRQFSSIDFRLYYSANTETYGTNQPALAAAPSTNNLMAVVDGPDVVFMANVTGDPAAGIQEVWVTYTDGSGSSGTWTALDLTQDPVDSTLWTGRLTGGASIAQLDYVLHAVNGVGLVSVDDNYGAYHSLLGPPGAPEPDPTTLTLAGANPTTAPFGAQVGVSATLDQGGTPVAGQPVLFSIGGATGIGVTNTSGVATSTLSLTATPGSYSLVASFGGTQTLAQSSDRTPFSVSKRATTLTIDLGTQIGTADGVDTGLVATLKDSAGSPLLQRTVYFTVTGGPDGPITKAVITDFLGRARLGVLDLPGGEYGVTAQFLGVIPVPGGSLTLTDRTYLGSSASTTLPLSSLEVIRGVREALAESLGGLSGNDANWTSLAITDLDDAIDGDLWVGDELDPDDGSTAIKEIRAAFVHLEKLTPTVTSERAIDILWRTTRHLAQVKIDQAIAAGGNQKSIDRAIDDMADADEAITDEDWRGAVNSHRKAWENAAKAL